MGPRPPAGSGEPGVAGAGLVSRAEQSCSNWVVPDGPGLAGGVGLNHLPSGRFPANAAWLAVQVLAHNLARWTARIGLGEAMVATKTLRRRFFSPAGRLTRKARRLTLHLPKGGPGKTSSMAPWSDCAPCLSFPDAIHGVWPVRRIAQLPRGSAPRRSPRVSRCNPP